VLTKQPVLRTFRTAAKMQENDPLGIVETCKQDDEIVVV
jgi:hypothetical protein